MGLLDKVKGLTKGREKQIKQGIDKAADVIQKKVPDQHDAKIETAADKAKGFVDKLDRTTGGTQANTPDNTPENTPDNTPDNTPGGTKA